MRKDRSASNRGRDGEERSLAEESSDELFEDGRLLQVDLPPDALAAYVQVRLRGARRYVQAQRNVWRVLATTTHLATLALSAAATIVLGFAQLTGLGALGFIFSALVTTISAIEPFYNWRSRWVISEEALAEWYRIEEDLTIYVASNPAESLNTGQIMAFDQRFVGVWENFNRKWLQSRKGT